VLTGQLRSLDSLPENDWRRTAPRFSGDNLAHNLVLADRVRAIAEQHGVTPGQLALAWVLAQGATAIPGTKRRSYLEENVAAATVALNADTLAELDAAIPAGEVAGERYVPMAMQAIQE
jgi:aryl-alcohol dehydrogenase-like predicted oxidoreductase